jgi:hypothetical protein
MVSQNIGGSILVTSQPFWMRTHLHLLTFIPTDLIRCRQSTYWSFWALSASFFGSFRPLALLAIYLKGGPYLHNIFGQFGTYHLMLWIISIIGSFRNLLKRGSISSQHFWLIWDLSPYALDHFDYWLFSQFTQMGAQCFPFVPFGNWFFWEFTL